MKLEQMKMCVSCLCTVLCENVNVLCLECSFLAVELEN